MIVVVLGSLTRIFYNAYGFRSRFRSLPCDHEDQPSFPCDRADEQLHLGLKTPAEFRLSPLTLLQTRLRHTRTIHCDILSEILHPSISRDRSPQSLPRDRQLYVCPSKGLSSHTAIDTCVSRDPVHNPTALLLRMLKRQVPLRSAAV